MEHSEVNVSTEKPSHLLGFNKEETTKLTDKLNLLLCNLQIHYQKLRSYHWNVTGGDFFDLHEKFEDEYNEVKVEIDEVAERIRVFGKTPASLLVEYLDHAEIKETSPNIPARQMAEEMLRDYETLLSHMLETLEVASEIGDPSTRDMMSSFMRRKEKSHWMLTAFLKK